MRRYRYASICALVSFPAVPVVALFGLAAAAIFELVILGGVTAWSLHR